MQKFILKFFYFLITPMLLFFLIIELILHLTPNTFNTKAAYLKENLSEIEVLFLGSSHTLDGINPEFMDLNSANLGYSSQDYEIDYALLEEYIDNLPNLKYIIQEVDMIDLYKHREEDYFRYPWYEKYYNIKLGSYPKYKTWSLYLSNPDFFNNYLRQYFISNDNINKYGYNNREKKGEFYRANYNEMIILKNSKNQLKHLKVLNNTANLRLKDNLNALHQIETIAHNNDIMIIKVAYPMHQSYYKDLIDYEGYLIWKKYLNDSKNKGEIVLDFEKSNVFNIKDFANSSHLNNFGAKKLTKMINDSIKKIERSN